MRAELARWRREQPERASRLDDEALRYADYHAARYAKLLEVVAGELALRASRPGRTWILDVGPNVQSVLLRRAYPDAIVDTLGFAHPAAPPRAGEAHVSFDLNDAGGRVRPPGLRPHYDVVVLAEVVEHLHAPLHEVLGLLAAWLRPGGAVVVQTPNGAALHKRLRLLAGRSPVEPPRSSRENPGHLHEYTLGELRRGVEAAGLHVERLEVANLFGSGPAARSYRIAGRVLPPSLRHGVTLCARARAAR